MKVFDCQKMPDGLRKKFFGFWDHKGNDTFIECIPGEWIDSGGDYKDVGGWLIANGADEDETILVSHWW
jgi:hypothetical protein